VNFIFVNDDFVCFVVNGGHPSTEGSTCDVPHLFLLIEACSDGVNSSAYIYFFYAFLFSFLPDFHVFIVGAGSEDFIAQGDNFPDDTGVSFFDGFF